MYSLALTFFLRWVSVAAMKDRNSILVDVFVAAGSMAELARKLNITRAAISHWQHVPFRHLKEIAKITGISRKKLRPDLYD